MNNIAVIYMNEQRQSLILTEMVFLILKKVQNYAETLGMIKLFQAKT